MSEDFDFGVRVTNVDAALRDLGRVESANRQMAQATQQSATTSSRAVQQLGTSVQQMGQRTGQAVGAIGQMATQLGALAPSTNGAGQAISQLGGAVGALSGAMGPLGVALGVATAAIGLLGAGFRAQQSAMDASRAAVVRLTASYEDLAAAATRAANAQRARARVEAGGGTLAEQQGFTQEASNRQELYLRALQGDTAAQGELRRQGLIQSGGDPSTLESLGAMFDDVTSGQRIGTTRAGGRLSEADQARLTQLSRTAGQQALDRQQLEAGAAVNESLGRIDDTLTNPPGRRRRGGRGGGGAADDARSEAEGLRRIQQMLRDDEQARLDSMRFIENAEKEHQAELLRLAQESADEIKRLDEQKAEEARRQQEELKSDAETSMRAFADTHHAALMDVIDAWQDANRALRASGGQMLSTGELLRVGMTSVGNQIADTIGGTMVGAFEQALGAWLDGSKSFVEAAEEMAKGVLKALVIESIVQAVTEGARAITSAASYDFAGAAMHAAAAAAWAAVGVVAGGVGAGIGAFGGGGKETPSAASAATPTDSTNTAQVQQPMIFNVYPGGFVTRHDVTAGIYDALEEGGRNGMRLSPGLIGA